MSFSRSSAMLGATVDGVQMARKKTSMKAVTAQTTPAYQRSASARKTPLSMASGVKTSTPTEQAVRPSNRASRLRDTK